MAITQDARSTPYNAGGVSGDPHTFQITLVAADCLVVSISREDARTITAVRSGSVGSGSSGQLLTAGPAIANGANKADIYYLVAPTTGTREIWIDLSAGSAAFGAIAAGLIGVDQANPIADSDTGQATGASSVTLNSALDPDGEGWLEVAVNEGASVNNGHTFGQSIAEDADQDQGAAQGVFGHLSGVSSAITPSCALDSGTGDWAMAAVLFRPAAAGTPKSLIHRPRTAAMMSLLMR